ncbi:MAG TPA: lamin tail domain-containing protein [Archangium sp.]|nr:lamin tail domain-containing protein [Archangium sp.]
MKSGPHTFARLVAWSVLLLGLSVGCGSGCGSDPNPPPAQREMPDADASLVEASKSQGIRANGKDVVDIKVTVRKADGTALAGRTVKVTVSGEAVTVVQPAGPTDAQGVAIAKVTSTVAGTKTVTASVEAQGGPVTLTSRPSLEFVVLPASKLAFTTAPRMGTAGEALGVFEVSIQNADGETMTAATNTVTVAMGSGPAAASLKGTLSVAAVNGVARFSTLMLERAAQGYTLTANASGLSGATSPAFDVTSAAPASLVLAQVPTTVTAGSALSPEVSVLDTFGNVVTGYTGTVRFSSDDAVASLPSDYTFTSADAGRHVFTGGLVLKRAGARRVAVTDSLQSTLTAASELGVVAGPAAAILFTEQPGNHPVRSPFGAQVALLDAFGNRVTASGVVVTLGLGESGPFEGIAPATTVDGVASFSGISIALDAVGYVLTASADGLLTGSSAPFTITDDVPPASPVLEEQAATATTLTVGWRTVGDDGLLGESSRYELRYSTAPIVSDSDFERATLVKQVIVPRRANIPDSAKISGLTPNTTYYVALEVKDNAGNTVRVTRPVSTPYPTASKLALLDQPSNKTAGSTQAPLRVAIQDEEGLLVTNATSAVTLTVEGVTGFGPFIAMAENGVATFSDVRIDTAGRGYTLKATSGSLTPATSNPFDIQHAPASRLALTEVASRVSSGTPGRATVKVLDAYGNVAEDYTGSVALSSSDAAASLPEAHAFISTDMGRFTFENITLRTVGMQTLTASAAGLTASTVELEVLPRKLLLTGLPATLKAGYSATVTLEVLDGFGVRDPGYTGTVRFSSSDSKATLPSEYTFATADLGLKTFTVRFVSQGEQTLTVQDTAMATLSATASTHVKWGDAVKLVLEAPESVVAGTEFSARVTALDGFGHTVEDYTGTVSFFASEPGSKGPSDYAFTLDDRGSRSFSFTLKTAVSTGIAVTDPVLSLSATDTVDVSAAPASRLVLAVVPAPTEPVMAGTGLTVEVTAEDAYGNVATDYAGTVRFESSDAQAVLPADASFAGAGGRQYFPVTLKTAGEQSLSAKDVAAPLLSEGTSVRILSAPASSLALSMLTVAAPQVSSGTPTRAMVTVLDAYGNVAEDYTGTVALSSSDTAATLPGAHTFTAATDMGRFTFENVTLVTAGMQTLTASAAGLTAGTTELEVLPRTLLLTDLPATLKAGESAMVMVEVLDGFGVRDPGYTGTVRFTSSDAKAGLPSEYAFTTADLGFKAFNVRFVSQGEQTLTVQDTAMATLSVTASTRVKWGDAVKLVLEAPESVVAGTEFSARVTALDGFGHTVEDYGGTVSFSSFEPGSTLPGLYTFTLDDKGSRAFSFTLERAVSTELAVMDVALALNATDTVAVSHAPASRLTLAVVPVPTGPVMAGTGLTVEVTARDAYGNLATGYAGTVRFESSDVQAVLPADASFAGAGGSKSFPVTLKTAGEQSVSAKDTVAALVSESAIVQILPGSASKLAFRAPPQGGKVRVAMAPVTVAITDLYGNTVSADQTALTVGLVDGNPDAVLSGTTMVSPSGGVATFSTLTVDQQGVGFRLEVMGGSFDTLSSDTFVIEDDLAPEAPTLSWANKTSIQLAVQWTAVADDGLLGPTASSHELRYSTSPITEATFASATLVDAGWPQFPGSQESVLIQGLTPSTTYYFGLKVMDDAGNLSVLSTLSTATNVDPCAGYTCPVSASTCAADGVSRTSYTATCVDVNNAPSCGPETPTTTVCTGADGVCFKGACGTAPKPGAGSLSISEVMHSPSSGTTEYVELTNNTGGLLNLNGLSLEYTLGSGNAAGSVTVGSGSVPVVVEGKGTFVLAQNNDFATNGGVSANVAYDSEIILEDSGTLKLTQGSTTVEFFTYTTAFPRTTGRSMNLASLVVGTKANTHTWYWCDSSAQLSGGDFGTPNAPNSDCGIAPAAPVDYCAIQYPKTFPSGDGNYPATVAPGSSWDIYSQFYEPGLTDRNTTGNDNYPHVVAELGYGTDSTNPAGWAWTPAAANLGYNSAFSNNDEVVAKLSIPTAGTYKYGFRYRLRDPATGTFSPYTYCDQSGATTPPAGSYGTVSVVAPPPPVLTNYLVISEVCPGTTANANDEFIELHNPTNSEVSLSNWRLQYKSATGASYTGSYTFSIGAKIPARGYYLVSSTSYSGSTIAEATYGASMAMGGAGGHVRLVQADGTTVVDTVGYGSTANAPEGTAITGTLASSGSYERKAVSTSTAATMAVGGSDATRGNGYDSNNNANDFVLRTTRQPQNSASATEVP